MQKSTYLVKTGISEYQYSSEIHVCNVQIVVIVFDKNDKNPFIMLISFEKHWFNIGTGPQSTYLAGLSVSLHGFTSNSSQNNGQNEQNLTFLPFC